MFNRVKSEETILDEDMPQLFWTCEGTSTTKASPKTINQEDKKALQIVEDTLKHNGERYEIGLPWKQNTQLPNNYFLAKAQLRSLEKRLNEDRQLADTYNSLIQNDIVKGYVEETNREPSPTCNQLWHVSHHPVQHKQKKKIRRVTNAASIYKGHSLNKALLTGPDLLCSLVGLLLRFRHFAIAVTGDIEVMFMQIAVRKEDQDTQVSTVQKQHRSNIQIQATHNWCNLLDLVCYLCTSKMCHR